MDKNVRAGVLLATEEMVVGGVLSKEDLSKKAGSTGVCIVCVEINSAIAFFWSWDNGIPTSETV